MTILLTGANGQVGNELKSKLINNHIDVIPLDSKSLNITSKKDVDRNFIKYKPRLIVNAAAYTNVNKAEKDEYSAFLVNETGTMNLAKACKDFKIPMFHLSTDYVFDGNSNRPYIETDILNPLGVYGKSKEAGEKILRNTLSEHIIIRTSWIFSVYGNNFVKKILELGKKNKKITVVSDQIGGPTSANSIAQYLLLLIKKFDQDKTLLWGTFHFCQKPYCSWYEFAQEIINKAHEIKNYPRALVEPISSKDFLNGTRRPQNSCLNSKKLESIFNTELYSYWKNDLIDVIKEL